MAKSVEKTKAALKLRTDPKENSLSLRLGTKKFVLPFEVRLLQSSEYVFVHIPPSAEIFRLTNEGLAQVTSEDEAGKAAKTFRKSRKRTRTSSGRGPLEVPEELKAALDKVPAGLKISYTADGKVKLVKARRRRKASA